MSRQPVTLRKLALPALPSMPCAALMVEAPVGDECLVEVDGIGRFKCCVLQLSAIPLQYAAGDTVLVLPLGDGAMPVVIGRIRDHASADTTLGVIALAAEQALSLRCGKSSIDLRADGKVMIRGEDVFVRAKGTKRIRAGTVAIN